MWPGSGVGVGGYEGTKNNSHSSRLLIIKLILPSVLCCIVSLYRGGVIFQIDGCRSNEHRGHKHLGCVSAYQTTWFHIIFVFHCSVVTR